MSIVQPQLKFWCGYVKLKLTGDKIADFINLAAKEQLQLWDIHFKAKDAAELTILLQHFFRLRPLLRQTSCKIHVLERYGAPFFLDKLGTRKFLIAGMLLFAVALFLMSSVIWQVKVVGNDKIQTAHILEVAKLQGIRPFQWKFKLKNPESLSRELQRQLPSTSWVGVQYHGSHLTIEVVESAEPEKKPLLDPRHLVASTNAIITQIKAEKGMPMVKVHSFVRKGDVLISGFIGTAPNQQIVVAKGVVMGEVWYTSKIEVPVILKQNSYTGESSKRLYVVFGNRALQITGYKQSKFELSTKQIVRKSVHWHKWTLPIGWIQESMQETQILEQKRSQEEAVKIGLDNAEANILKAADPGARILTRKILHERFENGKVYMEAHYEVEQSIVQDQPIIQGE
ncbi:sporulation protein YqfD [Paenibacillus psychroresistens]|uniref:Sporulation protein YqfD n=1 Tax=Paenibacillus psychroresistens TaxID=1778678 RepID=A0A6B8RJ06_9BACL|nr:sporulation protein YqfD [Paenibacillus psychroresistens]QGQ95724.1 sporulation protein YqfD [Paenibacillus psychroresistens]